MFSFCMRWERIVIVVFAVVTATASARSSTTLYSRISKVATRDGWNYARRQRDGWKEKAEERVFVGWNKLAKRRNDKELIRLKWRMFVLWIASSAVRTTYRTKGGKLAGWRIIPCYYCCTVPSHQRVRCRHCRRVSRVVVGLSFSSTRRFSYVYLRVYLYHDE